MTEIGLVSGGSAKMDIMLMVVMMMMVIMMMVMAMMMIIMMIMIYASSYVLYVHVDRTLKLIKC
jgi:hypothetical protein